MRLIHASNHTLHEFFGNQIPKYAILSHTWGDQEVSLQEWRDQKNVTKDGYQKIINACVQAESDEHHYIWVDTVCIDKSSSAELSEAINSMFSWYARSEVCYAYLVDVSTTTSTRAASDMEQLERSRWFTRGWTLQELLAPQHVVFYSVDWARIGTKYSLKERMTNITGITGVPWSGSENGKSATVAQKMSWISRRETTREEDMAYCMLGLFDIHMPLLYGEGSQAFVRLQEEILKTSNDHTIFCWTRDTICDNASWLKEQAWPSALAHSPAAFRYSSDFCEASWDVFETSGRYPTAFEEEDRHIAPYSMTNFGLSIALQTLDTWSGSIAILDASVEKGYSDPIGIPLRGNGTIVRRDFFPPCPVHISRDAVRDFRSKPSGFYIRHKPPSGRRGGSIFAADHENGHSWAIWSTKARMSYLVMFRNRKAFKSCSSEPPNLFNTSLSQFIVETTTPGPGSPQTLEHFFTSDNGYQGVISCGLLQLQTKRGKICNILLGSMRYRYDNQSENQRWCCYILKKDDLKSPNLDLHEIVERYTQKLVSSFWRDEILVGAGIRVYISKDYSLVQFPDHQQRIKTIVITEAEE